jgi:predicted ATPase
MFFIVTPPHPKTAPKNLLEKDNLYPIVMLQKDGWNDYGYMTLCNVCVVLKPNKTPDVLGRIRIMCRGQKEGHWVFTDGPKEFRKLDSNYCSLASREFYENLIKIGEEFAFEFLNATRDVIFSPRIWKSFSDDPCFQVSLLRDKSNAIELRDYLPKMYRKSRNLVTEFTFTTKLPGTLNDPRISFDFRRTQSSTIPNRVMLLVGTNGAGKTQLLSKLAIVLSGWTEEEGIEGKEQEVSEKRINAGHVNPAPSFYGVVAISFNAFDKFEIPRGQQHARYSYTYCGIRCDDETFYTENDLINRIQKTIESMDDERRFILEETVQKVLGFQQANVFFDQAGPDRYRKMSAGQKIVLNILSHLIANLKDRTLVLFDEPETHLHPSLMTTLLTEIFLLLKKFNSFAILATHSPIIAQQIPSKSIRVISRGDESVDVTLPDIECFGESLSVISNALFETHEYERDYTSIIDKLLTANNNNPEAVESLFPDGLGSNARIYLWATAREKGE